MVKKILYLDVETTGLSAQEHGIVQIACIYEEDGKVLDTFSSYMKPIKGTVYDKEALKINGLKKKQIKKFPKSKIVFDKFIKFLDSKVDKFKKEDKMILVAYNGHFDANFVKAWAMQYEYQYIHAYIDYRIIDPLVIARAMWYKGLLPSEPENFKLGTMCKLYGIEESDHDAIDDIEATRQLFFELTKGWK